MRAPIQENRFWQDVWRKVVTIGAPLRARETKMSEDYGNKRAPDGQVYACGACGKVSRWRYGFDDKGRNDATPGWDESCMMHAVLVSEASITDPTPWTYPARVRKAKAVEGQPK
jgi:hypothetical protein